MALWLILFATVFFGWRRQRKLEERIDTLEKALDKAASAPASPPA